LQAVDNGNPDQGPAFLEQLQGLLDLNRIGLVGHSTGGGAMVDLVLDSQNSQKSQNSDNTNNTNNSNNSDNSDNSDNSRIGALVGLDAWVEPLGEETLEQSRYTVPSLFLRSAEWEGGINDEYLVPFVQRLNDSSELRQIEGITHGQFTTLYMYRPVVKWLGLLGNTDPAAFADYQRDTIRQFFDKHL
ncbi:MAG: hypothetical protein K9L21_04700, partial [Spirochaetia bacterium]|nr:hypothetical protein [Spirochaetia bacterium]